jgi:hypothetical protein
MTPVFPKENQFSSVRQASASQQKTLAFVQDEEDFIETLTPLTATDRDVVVSIMREWFKDGQLFPEREQALNTAREQGSLSLEEHGMVLNQLGRMQSLFNIVVPEGTQQAVIWSREEMAALSEAKKAYSELLTISRDLNHFLAEKNITLPIPGLSQI